MISMSSILALCCSLRYALFGSVGGRCNVGYEREGVAVARDARPYRGGGVGVRRWSRGDHPAEEVLDGYQNFKGE